LSLWLDNAVTALNELLAEVNALAHQLRKTDFRLQQGHGLLAPGRAVLQVLADEGPRTVPWIAAKQNASRQNVQIIADRFAEQGLSEFSPNPAHKKSDLVQITEKGRELLAASTGRQSSIVQRVRSTIEESQISSALELLRRLRQEIAATPQKDARAMNGHKAKNPISKPHPLPARHAEPESLSEESFPVSLL
jgi:DNA-binding MarR family transcriptional regulator